MYHIKQPIWAVLYDTFKILIFIELMLMPWLMLKHSLVHGHRVVLMFV